MFLNITEEDIRADCPHNAPLTLRAFNKINPRQFNTSVSPLNPFEIPRYAPKTVGQFAKALVSQQRGGNRQVTNALAVAETQQAILSETDPVDFIMDVGIQESKSGLEIDEVFRKPAPGELSMNEIESQIEIYTDMLSDVNLTGEEINTALATLRYYENLRDEQLSNEDAILDIISRDEDEMREGTPLLSQSNVGGYGTSIPTTRRKKSEMTEARAMGGEDTRTIERKEAKMRRKEERREKTDAAAAAERPAAAEDLPTVPSYQGLRGVTSGERESDAQLQSKLDFLSTSSTLGPIPNPPNPLTRSNIEDARNQEIMDLM
tara:strand:- start:157 stop:1116 length:960 start_codon:yes stop_codon:yes gene_type:complete